MTVLTPNVTDNLAADNLAGGFARGGTMIQLVAMAIALAAAVIGSVIERRRAAARIAHG